MKKSLAITNIKEQNYHMIKDFVQFHNRPEMQGIKLFALYTLIQKKGEQIESNDERLNNIKALRISKEEYIAIKRTGSTNSFYPCALTTIIFTQL